MQIQQKPVIDYFAGSATVTKNIAGGATGIYIANDGASALTFAINGMTMSLPAGKEANLDFIPFKSVTVTTTVAFRAWLRG